MTDLGLALGWAGILAGALAGLVGLRWLGLPSTYARDLLHVGAGLWVLGWPLWRGSVAPVALTALALAGTSAVPLARRRSRAAARIHDTVTGGDERWTGIVLYTASFAAMTAIGLGGAPLPAGGALLALALGDGIGGAIGRRFGRLRFRAPGGKPKTAEGSLAVALGAAAGALAASAALSAPLSLTAALAVGAVAAAAEALAPRGTDNAIVPAAAFLTLLLLT